jgi:murein DD-endopeptidase MepM/ murein hydrolase activator NlpD
LKQVQGIGVALALALAGPAPALAASGGGAAAGGETTGGGAPPVARPSLRLLACVSRCSGNATAAAAGSKVTVQPKGILRARGHNLGEVTRIVFAGVEGPGDDVGIAVRRHTADEVTFRAPTEAPVGPLRAIDAYGQTSRPTRATVEISQPAPAPAPAATPAPAVPVGTLDPALASGHVFPIQGAHDYGDEGARFGAPRAGHTHQGQDVIAACGTPLVVARGGTVKANTSQSAAGNYVVIAGDTGYDYVYMHLRDPALPPKGSAVSTGQPIGYVGDTGDAEGCHLHFELWAPPGWYTGGAPFDPLPVLLAWDGKTAP